MFFINRIFLRSFFYDVAHLIPNRFLFFNTFSSLIKKGMYLVPLHWLGYPLICVSWTTNDLNFSLFYIWLNFCICFFVFNIGNLIGYPYFFNIHIIYLHKMSFWSNETLFLQSQRHQILRISYSSFSHQGQPFLLYHTKAKSIFNRITKVGFLFNWVFLSVHLDLA